VSKIWKALIEIILRPKVKHGLHCTDIHETYYHSVNFLRAFLVSKFNIMTVNNEYRVQFNVSFLNIVCRSRCRSSRNLRLLNGIAWRALYQYVSKSGEKKTENTIKIICKHFK
jgi:hypothetical protein